MLHELAVYDLGVIPQLSLVFEPGLTVVTGETGAGKTMVVEALELLVGSRADPALVRPGATEAVVEGRFIPADGDELVVRRVVAREGRSRAYLNGRLATVGEVAEATADLVEIHGQHGHQGLLAPATQRHLLDNFGRIDTAPRDDAAGTVNRITAGLDALGGDDRARAREIDLLRFQCDELDAAALIDDGEDDILEVDEDALAGAQAHREAAYVAVAALTDDGGAVDAVGRALAALGARSPFAELASRLASVQADLADASSDVRVAGEVLVDDPERLAWVRSRRQLIRDLLRKYGTAIADVRAFHQVAATRLEELLGHEERARALQDELDAARHVLAAAEADLLAARRHASGGLADGVEAWLHRLAMPSSRVGCRVDGRAGDEVVLLLAANSGAELMPVARAASGGELARTMLAIRLVSSDGPPTAVLDEVDAGVGGEAAVAVGAALAELAVGRQVLVVTHLAQVAAHADHHVALTKHDDGVTTATTIAVLDADGRAAELSRMLSGTRDSETARRHAEELLERSRPHNRRTVAPERAPAPR